MGLTESLGVHYNIIDYSGDGFWPLFGECVEAMGRCMRRHDPPAAERRRRIEYLAGWSLAIFSDFAEYYERELEGLCSGVDDLNVWRGGAGGGAGGGHGGARVLLGCRQGQDPKVAGPRAGDGREGQRDVRFLGAAPVRHGRGPHDTPARQKPPACGGMAPCAAGHIWHAPARRTDKSAKGRLGADVGRGVVEWMVPHTLRHRGPDTAGGHAAVQQ